MKPGITNILESYNNLNDQARYSIMVGVIFLVILLDVVFLVLPQTGGIASVNDQIKKLSEDTEQVSDHKMQINLLKKDLQKQRDQLRGLSIKVRSIQEVPIILSTISSIANEYGVKIDELVPEKTQQEVLTKSADDKYYALPIVIKARCGYHKFGHFLNKLESQDMFFILKDFIIQNDEKSPSTHLFSLTIKMILEDQTLTQSKNL